MKETCTLIKNSELEKLRTELNENKKLRKEYVEKKTEQLRNDISEKDKIIDELRKEIVEMKLNPQIDPMRLDINIERFIYRRKNDGGRYDYSEFYDRQSVFEPKIVNVRIDEPLLSQIIRIGDMILKRDRQIHEGEVIRMAEQMLRKSKTDFENKPKYDLLDKIMNMSWLQRIKYFKEYKEARKCGRSF